MRSTFNYTDRHGRKSNPPRDFPGSLPPFPVVRIVSSGRDAAKVEVQDCHRDHGVHRGFQSLSLRTLWQGGGSELWPIFSSGASVAFFSSSDASVSTPSRQPARATVTFVRSDNASDPRSGNSPWPVPRKRTADRSTGRAREPRCRTEYRRIESAARAPAAQHPATRRMMAIQKLPASA